MLVVNDVVLGVHGLDVVNEDLLVHSGLVVRFLDLSSVLSVLRASHRPLYHVSLDIVHVDRAVLGRVDLESLIFRHEFVVRLASSIFEHASLFVLDNEAERQLLLGHRLGLVAARDANVKAPIVVLADLSALNRCILSHNGRRRSHAHLLFEVSVLVDINVRVLPVDLLGREVVKDTFPLGFCRNQVVDHASSAFRSAREVAWRTALVPGRDLQSIDLFLHV